MSEPSENQESNKIMLCMGEGKMTQHEKRIYLIGELLKENKEIEGSPIRANTVIPSSTEEQKQLLRSLFNIRPPLPTSEEFIKIQDEYLKEEINNKGIIVLDDELKKNNIYLWKGDITRLKVDAIVNAANSALLGCFLPGHACIDNAIHTFAGVQLRLECDKIMKEQGSPEETGKAKITKAYNLPSKYVIHTVGPIIQDEVMPIHCELLKSSYLSSLELADEWGIRQIAFCCISTGAFSFPNRLAAEIAIKTVREYLEKAKSGIKVIFNVFNDQDETIYKSLL